MMNSKDIEKRLFIEDSIELQINSKNNNNTNVLKDRDFMGVPQEKLQPPTGKIEALADDLGDTFLEKKGKKGLTNKNNIAYPFLLFISLTLSKALQYNGVAPLIYLYSITLVLRL